MVAAKDGRHNVVNRLTAAGASLNICDSEENDALKLAQISGHGGIVDHLKAKIAEERLAADSDSFDESEMSSTESDGSSETEEHSFSSNRFPQQFQVPMPAAAPPNKTHPSTNIDTGKSGKERPSGSNVDTGSWNDTTESFSEPPKKPKKRLSFSWRSKSNSPKSIKKLETKISKDLIGSESTVETPSTGADEPKSSSVDPLSSSVDPPALSSLDRASSSANAARTKSASSASTPKSAASVKDDDSESDWKSSQEFSIKNILAQTDTGEPGDVDYAGIILKTTLGLTTDEDRRRNSEIFEDLKYRGGKPKSVNTLYAAKDLEPPQPHENKEPFKFNFSSESSAHSSTSSLERVISPQPPGNPPGERNTKEASAEPEEQDESVWDDSISEFATQPGANVNSNITPNPVPVQGASSEAKNNDIHTDSESGWDDSSDSDMDGNIENVKKKDNIFNHSDIESVDVPSTSIPISPRSDSSVISPRTGGQSRPNSETDKSGLTPSSVQSPVNDETTASNADESTIVRNGELFITLKSGCNCKRLGKRLVKKQKFDRSLIDVTSMFFFLGRIDDFYA
jgi:hypothetical protein